MIAVHVVSVMHTGSRWLRRELARNGIKVLSTMHVSDAGWQEILAKGEPVIVPMRPREDVRRSFEKRGGTKLCQQYSDKRLDAIEAAAASHPQALVFRVDLKDKAPLEAFIGRALDIDWTPEGAL